VSDRRGASEHVANRPDRVGSQNRESSLQRLKQAGMFCSEHLDRVDEVQDGRRVESSPTRENVRDEPAFDGRMLRRMSMLYTIAVILLVLWLLGFVSGYTMGAFIHVLLVVAIVLFLVGVVSGRRVV
jgi:hypothetical protein